MTGARKHTVAGTIPIEWDAKLIKHCCDVVRGASPRPAGDPKYFDGDYLPWITVADVTGMTGMYLNGTRTKLTKEGANFTRLIPPATLIITNSGATLGVPKITRELSGANDGIAVFLNLKEISKECLFYILESQTEYFRNELAPGIGQPNLNTELLGNVAISIPPPGEQDRIVGALSTWDTAIQKTEQLIAAKERRFNALRERLVAPPKKSVSSLTACERQTIRLGDIFALSKEVAKSGTNHEVLSVTTGGIVRQSEYFNKQVASEDKSGYLVARRGQLVMSGLNFWMGSIDFQKICDVGIVSPAYKVFSIVGTGLDIDYLQHYVRSSEMRKILAMSSVQGASIVRRNLDMDQLMDSSISIPNIETQRAIGEALNALENELGLLVEQCAAFKTQKRGLMQKLLTGQWRLTPNTEGDTP